MQVSNTKSDDKSMELTDNEPRKLRRGRIAERNSPGQVSCVFGKLQPIASSLLSG